MIEVVGFDADDTLWHNEHRYQEAKDWFTRRFGDAADAALDRSFARNLPVFGFGAKSLALIMLEAALEIEENAVDGRTVSEVVERTRNLLTAPVELVEGSIEVLEKLASDYRLLLVTKGDLADQWRKVEASGLMDHFAAIEILVHKDPATYRRLLVNHETSAAEFVMVGNSVASDVLPVLEIGGHAVHVPYPVTASIEVAPRPSSGPRFAIAEQLVDVPATIAEFS